MKLIKNVKALSRLSIIILLIASLIVGALLSYLWVMGYYLTLGIKIPENTTLSISDVSFSNQSTKYFIANFFNPSYSPSDANITKIDVRTPDNKIYNINYSRPPLPCAVKKAENTSVQCTWDWANYTGQKLEIIAFVNDGSGPTFEVKKTPFVGLTITDVNFNSSRSVTKFSFTVKNSNESDTYVNISRIIVPPPTGVLSITQVSPTLPLFLDINESKTFQCTWNWTNYQNKNITIGVYTIQGYVNYTSTTLGLLGVEITDVIFSESDMNTFNVTVRNRKESSTSFNITKVAVTRDGIMREINMTIVIPEQLPLPYQLDPNSTKTLKCQWNWTHYRGKDVTISIFTKQNYTVTYIKATPSPIEITNAIFNVADTNNFNITVYNSASYYTHVNITSITLTLEDKTTIPINGTAVSLPLPQILNQSRSMPFRCPWNWTGYQGKNVTITVGTAQNYTAQFVKTTPAILAITSISFDPANTDTFNIAVRNSAPLELVTITNVTITFENRTVRQVSISPPLPPLINPASTATFTCHWDWANYRGKTITIKVYVAKGYEAFTLYTTPPFQ